MKIVFATKNQNKVKEIASLLPVGIELVGLDDVGIVEDLPETSATIEGNALQKATYIKQNYGLDCFADDTGLEVTALDNEPGVRSARYAGEERSDAANIQLLLEKLALKDTRSARFRTVIALILGDHTYTFEGVVEGEIISEPRGINGFGYDPVFVPHASSQTFAEMDLEAKNRISHRARAFQKMIAFLASEKSVSG